MTNKIYTTYLKLLIFIFLSVLCSCTSYGKWEECNHRSMPYISANTLAMEKERRIHGWAWSFSTVGYGLEIIWTDDNGKKINCSEISNTLDTYIYDSGLYEKMRDSYNKVFFRGVEVSRKVPSHKFVIVSLRPILVLMIPFEYEYNNVTKGHKLAEEPWGWQFRCNLLEEYTVHTGTKVPYSENIMWFSPEKKSLPQPFLDMKIEMDNIKLSFKKEGNYIFAIRER
jgi:hypothetical protein